MFFSGETYMDITFIKPQKPIILKGLKRQLRYNKQLNLYKRLRTFNGINKLYYWLEYIKTPFNKKLNCLEIGSHEGQSAIFILKNILLHNESKLLCCDPFYKSHWNLIKKNAICYEDIFNFNMENNDKMKKIKKFIGLNSDLYKLDSFKKQNFDIVYIDDIHTYESTNLNILNCWSLINPGGYIIFDDYDANYAFKEKYDKKGAKFWCDPVKKSVDEFLDREKTAKVIFKEYQIIIKKNLN